MDYARGCQDDIHAPKPEERISRQHIRDLYALPLPELLFRAQAVHRQHFDPTKIQMATLVSIKTGACVEDCGYCAQSARHKAADYEPLMQVQEVLEKAREAKESGSVRLCMGAAWREIKDGPEFDRVLSMVRGVREMGLEACCTLGMLTEDQAKRLAEAGLTAYNHNLDTSPEYYSQIITTRTFEDRLRTLENVRKAGVQICSGGILGLGESREDRVGLLHELANLPAPPDSVPINRLMAMKGTPLQDAEPIDDIEVVRTIAVARILMPASRVRLSAGRVEMAPAVQFLCFFAGANSMFAGEKLLTAANPCASDDLAMLASFGMSGESVVEEVGQHH